MDGRDETADVLRAAGCVFAEAEATILQAAAATPAELAALTRRRAGGEPLELIVGWAEFCGLRVRVAPGVFVPRRRTELLARQAVARLAPGCLAVDLCCGAGAVAAVLERSGAQVVAADIDPAAVACARTNIAGPVFTGDLFAALPAGMAGAIDVLAANAPYVPDSELDFLPAEAREYEPAHTLRGGPDGLSVLRRIAAAAPLWLSAGGWLLSEASGPQSPALAATFAAAGLRAKIVADEELGATVVAGQRQ